VNVLVVDDTASVRERFVSMLAALPGVDSVIEAASASAALDALRDWQPDVVLLDLHLPDCRGLSLAARVKRARPAALLLVVTNHGTPQHRRRLLALGADALFDKSREFDEVVRLVAEAAARSARNS
jgi:DNA-binding NarL/FixJ family response regulator